MSEGEKQRRRHRRDEGERDRRASETVLSDIRILALDQRTDDVDSERVVAKTATLEVTPQQAEAVTLAQQLGTLSLALRPIARPDDAIEPTAGTFTMDSQVSRLVGVKQDKDEVVVMRGGNTATAEAGKTDADSDASESQE